MNIRTTTELDSLERKALLDLWNAEYPLRINYTSLEAFEAYLSGLSEGTFYLLESDLGAIKGWASSFRRENETWFALIIAQELHGKGYGTELLNHLKQNNRELSGWVIDGHQEVKSNGELYVSPQNFYLKQNFKLVPEVRLEIPTLSAVKIYWKRSLEVE